MLAAAGKKYPSARRDSHNIWRETGAYCTKLVLEHPYKLTTHLFSDTPLVATGALCIAHALPKHEYSMPVHTSCLGRSSLSSTLVKATSRSRSLGPEGRCCMITNLHSCSLNSHTGTPTCTVPVAVLWQVKMFQLQRSWAGTAHSTLSPATTLPQIRVGGIEN